MFLKLPSKKRIFCPYMNQGCEELQKAYFLDALASLKTMLDIDSFIHVFKISRLECVAESYRVLQSVTEYNIVLQSTTEYYRVLQTMQSLAGYCRVIQSIREYCRVL